MQARCQKTLAVEQAGGQETPQAPAAPQLPHSWPLASLTYLYSLQLRPSITPPVL